MLDLNNCPLCNANDFREIIKCIDYTVSHETFQIVKCKSCGHLFTNPRPDDNDLGKYYESDEYISHSNSQKGLFNKAYQVIRQYTISKKVTMMNRVSRGTKSILDIGSGTGEFLFAVKKIGWKVQGLEPSKKAREFATNKYDLTVNDSSVISQLPDNSFEVITMWHVLEHVVNIQEMAEHLKRLLLKDGTLLIAVPNNNSKDAAIYKEQWAAWDVPRHLHHFTITTMTKLFKERGMEVVKIMPMYFDSFYVCMLSEKYKTGKVNIVSALINGLKSNLAGSRDIDKYSSLIFQIKNSNSN